MSNLLELKKILGQFQSVDQRNKLQPLYSYFFVGLAAVTSPFFSTSLATASEVMDISAPMQNIKLETSANFSRQESKQNSLEVGPLLAETNLELADALNEESDVDFTLTPGSQISLGVRQNVVAVRRAIAEAVRNLITNPTSIQVTPIQIQIGDVNKPVAYMVITFLDSTNRLVRIRIFDAPEAIDNKV
ncbi:MAG: hypothetical protein OHK0017_04930 [Patescibacteria group bacterium]